MIWHDNCRPSINLCADRCCLDAEGEHRMWTQLVLRKFTPHVRRRPRISPLAQRLTRHKKHVTLQLHLVDFFAVNHVICTLTDLASVQDVMCTLLFVLNFFLQFLGIICNPWVQLAAAIGIWLYIIYCCRPVHVLFIVHFNLILCPVISKIVYFHCDKIVQYSVHL